MSGDGVKRKADDHDGSNAEDHLEENNGSEEGFHENNNNEGSSSAKKSKKNEELDIRFLISSKEAGAIIGKGGANINHLRKHYKSSVTVPDCPGPERVLSIVTSLDALHDILADVIGYVDDRPQKNAEKEVELRLLIHTSHAGGIIGRGGQRIRELRDQTKAAIKVFTQCCPLSTERVCAIQGSPEVVIQAIKTILDIIMSTPIKGVVKLYDPYHFDIYAAGEYGGYIEPGPPGAYRNSVRGPTGASRRSDLGIQPSWQDDPLHGQHIPPPPDPWVRSVGSAYDPPPGTERRGPPPPPLPQASFQRWMHNDDDHRRLQTASTGLASDTAPYWSDVVPSSETVASNMQMSAGPPMRGWTSGYETANDMSVSDLPDFVKGADGTAQGSLTVPNSVAGAIIGKGGNRIRIVRRDSGADISIETAAGPGKDRVITIKGTQQQVKMAYSMLQRSIVENSRMRY